MYIEHKKNWKCVVLTIQDIFEIIHLLESGVVIGTNRHSKKKKKNKQDTGFC